MANQVKVHTVQPTKIDDGKQLISWSRRSTDKNPVKAEERYRGVMIPETNLQLPDGACQSKFQVLLQSTIDTLAAGLFQEWASENMLASEYDADRLTVSTVLTHWAAQRDAAKIDAAKITAFLNASPTFAKLPEATRKAWLIKVPKIASPAYANLFTQEQAAVIISRLSVDDCETPEGAFIVARCNAIMSRETVEEAL